MFGSVNKLTWQAKAFYVFGLSNNCGDSQTDKNTVSAFLTK